MSKNQQLSQEKDISEFQKNFYEKYGVRIFIYTPQECNDKIPLDVFHTCTLDALHENVPEHKKVPSLKEKIRFRSYLVYVQTMSYLAHKEGHSKTSIGKYLNRNHATIINSCKMVDNGFFTKDKVVIDAYNNILNKLIEHVGTIPKNFKSKTNTKSTVDSIWDEARSFISN